ncbi:putative P450 monooxygenase [Zymoseptoria tritici IPO323]|uniref:P450 monooxygenase n=1 Tax=Zymoseptoria tritici (strain CBS 115943 / IPO323) TaxID=336722 RepID=F9X0K1_ZYMTI|nr:putative P450 monooxygenase [Zymoseptoria tritici IPO323]EGP91637.1 putative P450 monooxygenase [Zymoseptoria tritici IPO323]
MALPALLSNSDTSSVRTLSLALLGLLISSIGYLLHVKFRPGLRRIPGPWLASISSLDRLRSAASGQQMNYHLKLHEQYGPLVRIGPNHVSFAYADLIPDVYGVGTKFRKSDFYTLFDTPTTTGVAPNVFSVRDEVAHRDMRRPAANAYSMSSLRELEPMNDACSAVIVEKFNKYVDKEIDLGTWLQWYAFDVVTSITFSNTLGMLEQERDVDNVIEAIEAGLAYNSVIGQVPWLHKLLFGNPMVVKVANLVPSIRKMSNSFELMSAFLKRQVKRYENEEFNTIPLQDMLSRFKRVKDGKLLMSDDLVLSHTGSNIFAGSDTTAISLRSVFYNLCRNKQAHDKLLAEIDEADRNGLLSNPVSFAEAQRLPYFQAVMKEALRLHPAVGQLLERRVPKGGADIGGAWLPEGTIVGMNPWVSARDGSVYGLDHDDFRPERWLEASETQLRLMDRNDLSFGAGARTCLGKNISILEMSKLIPELYRHFDFELTDPTKEWELHDYWFVKQTGLICKVKRRERSC